MSNTPKSLSRKQLAEFLPDPRAVKAFEQVLKSLNTSAPDDLASLTQFIQDTYLEAALGTSTANEALSQLAAIARALDQLVQMPPIVVLPSTPEVSPSRSPLKVNEVSDVSVKLPVAGSLLIYDATTKTWRNATLSAGTNVTITNADAAITITADMAGSIHAAASKATPVDADEMGLADSAASFALKKLTWANLKATLKTYFDTLYQAASANLTAWAGKTAPTGTVVGTSDTQTLTNKTIDSSKTSTTFGVGGTTPAATGAGISFPAAQSNSSDPNTLDDYEEGAWTLTVTPGTGAITTYSTQAAAYTKVGNLVTATFKFTITTNGTGASYLQINLPFASAYEDVGSARENGVTGKQCTVRTAGGLGSNAFVLFYDSTYPGSNGAVISGTVTYRTS